MEDRENLLARREIVTAYVEVLERPEDLFEVCSTVAGDSDELRAAVQRSYGLSPIAADAVLALQVRRFTPNERIKIREELADIDRRIERFSGA